MTQYRDDNLPENMSGIEPLPEELFRAGYQALRETMEHSGAAVAAEIKAAYVFGDNGVMDLDQFGGNRNTRYGTMDDDIVLQLTVRIKNPTANWRSTDAGSSLGQLEEDIAEHYRSKKSKILEAEILVEEILASEALQRANEKREELEALNRQRAKNGQ